jgi:CheY-like chemotaxis protein
MAGIQTERRAPLRVLVVDPNTDAADSAAVLLRIWGYDVRSAYNAAQASAEAKTYRPEVLLTEVALPGCDGYALARRMRALVLPHRLTCVAVTGYGQVADRQRSDAEGFTFHLVKPVDPCQVRDILEALADTRSRRPAQEANGNSYGARLVETQLRAETVRSWRDDPAALLMRVHTISVAFRSQSEVLREKSRALRRRSRCLYLAQRAEGEIPACLAR